MMSGRGIKLSDEDMQDILEGATFLGSGGGGSKDVGESVLKYLLSLDDHDVTLLDPNPNEGGASPLEWVTTMAGIGSPSDAEKLKHPFSNGPMKAFEYLSELVVARRQQLQQQKKESTNGDKISNKINYVCPGEIGPWSTMITLLTAAQTSSPVIDADGGGRAYPNLDMTAYAGAGISVNPMTLANDEPKESKSSVTAGFQVETESIVEDCSRSLLQAKEFQGVAGFSTWAMTIEQLRSCMTANTISLAMEIGKTLRVTKEGAARDITTTTGNSSSDHPYVVSRVIDVLKARGWYSELLFTGTVEKIISVTRNTFDYDNIWLKDDSTTTTTTGRYALIEAENENLLMYRCTDMEGGSNKTPICIGPDSICYLLESNGTSITNVNLKETMKVHVIGIQASDVLTRYRSVMKAFQTTLQDCFNYDGGYVPLQTLSKQNKEKEMAKCISMEPPQKKQKQV